MNKRSDHYEILPFPRVRQPIVDALRGAKSMSIVHALVEFDITDARDWVRDYRKKTDSPLSFTAFLVFCLARAVDENKLVHAYRKGGKLIVFDEVDVAVQIERDILDEGKAPIYPHVVKAANRKSLNEIQTEISTARAEESDRITRQTNRYWYLPGFIRILLWRTWLGSPSWRKKLTGTVSISSVGMFGQDGGWGIPICTYSLGLTVGGITHKPGVVKGQIAVRQYLSVTASFDHAVIDGAPSARFLKRLKELVESGHGLR